MSKSSTISPVHGWTLRGLAGLVLYGGIAFLASRLLQRRPATAGAPRAHS